MTRKSLPKAIRPTNAKLVQAVVGAVTDDDHSVVPAANEAIEPEWAQHLSSTVPANDADVSMSSSFQKLAAKRRVLAGRIEDDRQAGGGPLAESLS